MHRGAERWAVFAVLAPLCSTGLAPQPCSALSVLSLALSEAVAFHSPSQLLA